MSFSLLKLYQQPIKLQVSIEVRREKQMGIKEKEEGKTQVRRGQTKNSVGFGGEGGGLDT